MAKFTVIAEESENLMLRLTIFCASLLAAFSASKVDGHARPSVVRVLATDYALTVSTVASSGTVRVRLVNRGREFHHLEISPVPDSLSLGRFYQLATGDQPSTLVHDIGGPNLTRPGDSSEVTLQLASGRYILTCWVNATDGKPHIMRGMMAEIRVPRGEPTIAAPAASVVIRASDYAFDINRRLRAGDNMILFENDGPQEHDIQVVRLRRGETTDAIRRWAARGGVGAPDDEMVGGSTGIDKGERVWFTLHLQPGRYAMFCFVPDAKDGKMHLLHGMLQEFIAS